MFSNIPSRGKIFWPRHSQNGRRPNKSHETVYRGPFDFHNKLFHDLNHWQSMDHSLTAQFFWSNPIAQPHSFEELAAERSYLLNALQKEDGKATELLKRIAYLQDVINSGLDSQARKKAKKTIGWLKYRLQETNAQEKSILSRLGQVSYEIQHGERLRFIENEQFICSNIQLPYVAFQQMQLDDSNPTFPDLNFASQGSFVTQQPGQVWNNESIPYAIPHDYFPAAPPHANESELPAGPASTLASDSGLTANEISACKTPRVVSSHLRQSTSMDQRQHLKLPVDERNEKRHSEPVMRTVWDDESGTRYLGFFHAGEDACSAYVPWDEATE